MSGRVLIVDDERDFCELAADWLRKEGFVPEWCLSAEEALSMHAVDEFDVVLADLHLAEMNGLELCKRVVGGTPDVPVVMMTAFGSLETAIGAIRAGAYDFVVKPCDRQQLGIAVRRAFDHRALKGEVRRLKEQIAVASRPDSMIGDSPSMRRVYDLIDRVGDSDATVLICGESGTGKELVAQALHRKSRRRGSPLVAVNCAALPGTLLESELFGHVRGAFTDAKHDRAGLFEQADGSTIFLDEISEMPPEMQVKLLRALQDKRVRRVGGTEEKPFDARIIAATNRDIEDAVESGRFRDDLYYRINVVRIDLPPLRSRGNDVLLLAQTFIGRAAERSGKRVLGLSTDVAHRLREYNWPGNVRELSNCIEAAIALTKFEELVVDDLPERIRRYVPQDFTVQTTNPSELPSLAEIERRYIFEVLNAVGGNKSAAAKILGFDRRTLYRKLESYLGQRTASDAP